jgi:hypothetical protein
MAQKIKSSFYGQDEKKFANPEKKYHEKWTNDRPIEDIPRPYRICIAASPNQGKTSLVLRIIALHDDWDNIILLHGQNYNSQIECDKDTKPDQFELDKDDKENIPMEYRDIEFSHILKAIPHYSYFSSDEMQTKRVNKKNLLIIDDCDLGNQVGKRSENLSKILSYESTHRLLSVIICVQSLSKHIPAQMRSYCNVMVLFKTSHGHLIEHFARSIGFRKAEFMEILKLMKTTHDNITVDMTTGSPYPFRLNWTTPIEIVRKEVPRVGRKGTKKIDAVNVLKKDSDNEHSDKSESEKSDDEETEK